MAIEASIRAALVANSTVNGLVAGRIYPTGTVPQGTAYPLITYNRTGSETIYTQGGRSGMREGTFGISAWAETSMGAVALADAISNAVGDVANDTDWFGTRVDMIEIVDEFTGYTQEAPGEDAVDFREQLIVDIKYCQ